jgi:uncharacterized protein (TIGR00730 family)
MEIKKLGVFCGASSNVSDDFKMLATDCGKLIAKHGLGLVYGGGDSGLMGAVARAAQSNGAEVTGVYPKILNQREPLNKDMQHTYIVDTMYQRKQDLIEKSDAFFILPGGFGTLDEFFEVVTLKYLGDNKKPIIVINHQGYWNIMRDLINHIIESKFAPAWTLDTFRFVDDLEDGFAKLGFQK